MKLRIMVVIALIVGTVSDGAAACASNHIQANLYRFPPVAKSRPLFWVGVGGTATFTIRVFGTSCDGTTVTINYAIQPGTASAADYTHPGTGQKTIVNGPGHQDWQSEDVTTTNDLLVPPEPVVEQATIALTSASNATVVAPSSAPLVIVDEDGAPRPSLADGSYEEQEGSLNGGVPVFRGGDTSGALPVSYTVTPGSATPGADYTAPASGTVTIPDGQRSAMIPISVVDDADREGSETLTVSIAGTSPQDTSSVTFTIRDNEESFRPTSTIHHPNNRKKYRSGDFRIREVHVFTSDNAGGSGVVRAEFALRRNHKGKRCTWWTKKKFKKGDCGSPKWKGMGKVEADFYFIRVKELAPSRGKIKNYTAFSRAIDGAGNVEAPSSVGENVNTFEVKGGRR